MTITRALVYALLAVAGVFFAWRTAPVIEAIVYPPFTDEYLMPFDPAHPEQFVVRQLDRVCWRIHLHKARATSPVRRSLTIIQDGIRWFSMPLDGRTGDPYSSKDAVPAGWTGSYPICTYLPNQMDATQPFQIESYGQYTLPHHLWTVEHTSPLVDVPSSFEGDK